MLVKDSCGFPDGLDGKLLIKFISGDKHYRAETAGEKGRDGQAVTKSQH